MGGLVLALSLIAVSTTAQQAPLPTPPNRIFPVFFDDFSSSLDDMALAIVAGAADAAKGFPSYKVKVTGYADQAGSTEREIELSRARADAVAAVLQHDGVEAGRIIRAAVGTPPNSQPGVERRRVEIDIDEP